MATCQDILNLARLDINDVSTDTAQYRYSDTDGMKYLNNGITRALSIRPDLRMGTATSSDVPAGAFGYGAFVDLTSTSTFPLPREFEEKLARAVVFGWQNRDDPYVNDNRSKMQYELFIKELLGG